jgi:hypothetical protein
MNYDVLLRALKDAFGPKAVSEGDRRISVKGNNPKV